MTGRRPARLALTAVLVAAGFILAVTAARHGSLAAAPGPTAYPAPPPVPPSAQKPASDGGLSMSVAGVDCAHPSAAGEYCYVTFNLVNVSDAIPLFEQADQVAYDPAGRVFHPDPVATAAANHGKPVSRRVQHGEVSGGVLVYALPGGDRIDHLVMHGKSGTPGETFTIAR